MICITHISSHSIDLILTLNPEQSQLISDHYFVRAILIIKSNVKKQKKITCRNISKINTDLLKKDLSELVVKYQSLKLSKLEEMYKFYFEELSNLLEKYVPNKIVKITIRDTPEWYGQEHLELEGLARIYEKLCRSVDKKEPAVWNIKGNK